MINAKELAGHIDHTNLKAYASEKDMEKLCTEAKEYGFAMVAINSLQVKTCKKYLEGTPVHVGAAISFPLGQTTLETKLFETETAIKEGADEIDYVVNLTEVKNGNYEYIKEEMTKMVELCHAHGIICKVIFENCYLEDEEIIRLAEIAREVKPDYIKTSTGFGTSGATLHDVKLMKETVGDEVKVKAAGGIRTLEDALSYLEAGCDRIGTSAGVAIINELKSR